VNPCSIRKEGVTWRRASDDSGGTRSSPLAVEILEGGYFGANVCVGVGVDKYSSGPES